MAEESTPLGPAGSGAEAEHEQRRIRRLEAELEEARAHLVYQAAGVTAFTVYISFEVWLFDKVRPAGGRGLIFLLTFVLAVLFWWWSAYMLLYRKVPLRRLLPAGVATGLCITGLGVVSSFVFSGQITDGQKSYGPAGVVLALISFLVGFGVCLHAGAVFGRMWNDWLDERASLDSGRD